MLYSVALFHRRNLLTSKVCQVRDPAETSENACASENSHVEILYFFF